MLHDRPIDKYIFHGEINMSSKYPMLKHAGGPADRLSTILGEIHARKNLNTYASTPHLRAACDLTGVILDLLSTAFETAFSATRAQTIDSSAPSSARPFAGISSFPSRYATVKENHVPVLTDVFTRPEILVSFFMLVYNGWLPVKLAGPVVASSPASCMSRSLFSSSG